MSLPQFVVSPDAVDGDTIVISDPAQVHHAVRVLRLNNERQCAVIDGTGTTYRCRVRSVASERLILGIEERCAADASDRCEITLVPALLKATAFDAVLRHSTELGVVRVLPVNCRRCVVRVPAAAQQAKLRRWQRIVQEAAKQCRRPQLPELFPLVDLPGACRMLDGATHLVLTLSAPGQPINEVLPALPLERVAIWIGPEGDFTAEEAQYVASQGGHLIRLPTPVLRAETAALAAVAMVQYEAHRRSP